MGESKKIGRRRFILLAGGALGASLLACGGGLAIVATPTPAMNFGTSACGKENGMKKILVTYASRYGSTAEVAQAIAAQLCARGEAVDGCAVADVTDVSAYRAVVVGSAVRMGQWLAPAVKFVEAHKDALSQVPVAYFTVHMLSVDDSEASRQKRAAYVAPVRAILAPSHEAFFAGKIDSRQFTLLDRLMTKATGSVDGDQRNWPAIRTWADQIFVN
jgi:menaquinone-dependent protoporphyrinogen oxidase